MLHLDVDFRLLVVCVCCGVCGLPPVACLDSVEYKSAGAGGACWRGGHGYGCVDGRRRRRSVVGISSCDCSREEERDRRKRTKKARRREGRKVKQEVKVSVVCFTTTTI